MATFNLRHILHSSLPCLLLWIILGGQPVAAQPEQSEEGPSISITVEVEDAPAPPGEAEPEDVPQDEAEPARQGTGDATGGSEPHGEAEPDPPATDETVEAAAPSKEDVEEGAETEAIEEPPANGGDPPTQTQENKSISQETVAKHLSLGQELLAQGRYLTIPGRRGSALNAFRMVLASDPENEAARKGVQAIVDRLVISAGEELVAGNRGRARSLLESAEAVVDPFVDRSALQAVRAALESDEPAEMATAAAETIEEHEETPEQAKEPAEDSDAGEEAVEPVVAEVDPGAAGAGGNPEPTAESGEEVAKAEVVEETPEAAAETDVADSEEASKPAEETVVAELSMPSTYHVGRLLKLDAPETDATVLRWTLDERTLAEGPGLAAFDYTFEETDVGAQVLRVYAFEDGEATLLGEGTIDVRYFEDIPQEYPLARPLTLDPTRHGPVEGTYGNYAWQVDGETVSTEPVFTWTFDETGTHRVECRMSEPETDSDRQWPAPVLAWTFDVQEPTAAAVTASTETAAKPAVPVQEAQAAPQDPGKNDPILVILGAAVIVLALSQAWMAYRLNVLSRAAGHTVSAPSTQTQPVALGSLPPEESYMEELHHRFRSHETIEE